jgi:hypothetical protein
MTYGGLDSPAVTHLGAQGTTPRLVRRSPCFNSQSVGNLRCLTPRMPGLEIADTSGRADTAGPSNLDGLTTHTFVACPCLTMSLLFLTNGGDSLWSEPPL